MRLTLYTDYSLRLLLYLAVRPGRLSTIKEVAEAYGISRNHMMKVAHDLGRNGFVETVRGRGGGLRLNRDPATLGIGEIVRATEEDFRIVECFDPTTNTCPVTGACRLQGILGEALAAWGAVLDQYTLADLLATPALLAEKLGLPLEEPGPRPAE